MKNNFDLDKFKIEKWLAEPVKKKLDEYLKWLKAWRDADLNYFRELANTRYPDRKDIADDHYEHFRKSLEKRKLEKEGLKGWQGLAYFGRLFEDEKRMKKTWESFARKGEKETYTLVQYLLVGFSMFTDNSFPNRGNEMYINSLKERKKVVNDLFRKLDDPELRSLLLITPSESDIKAFLFNKSDCLTQDELSKRTKLIKIPANYVDDAPEEFRDENSKFKLPYEIYDDFIETYTAYVEHIKKLQKNLNSEEYDSYMYLNFPSSRNKNADNSEALLFMRMFAIRIRRLFNTAMNEEIANVVNTLFDTDYSDNDVVKNTGKVRKSMRK